MNQCGIVTAAQMPQPDPFRRVTLLSPVGAATVSLMRHGRSIRVLPRSAPRRGGRHGRRDAKGVAQGMLLERPGEPKSGPADGI